MENSKDFLEDMWLLKYRFNFDDKGCGIIELVASLEKRVNELEELNRRLGKTFLEN